MSLSISSANLSEQLVKLPQKKITQVVILVLVIYIAYLLARITWLAVPQNQTITQVKTDTTFKDKRTDSRLLTVKGIQSLSLFGRFNEKEVIVEDVIIEDAPETRLKLILAGVVASNDKSVAAAIIQSSGKQETYSIGDNIKGTRAELESVFNDRVIIKVSGRHETLMFEGMKFDKKVQPLKSTKLNQKSSSKKGSAKKHKSANVVDQRNNKSLTAATRSLKNELNNDPGKITDYLKISPKRVGGKIIGYQLLPGKDPTFFKNSGLKSGDIAIQMNGFDLTAPREAAQALKSLKEQREISLLLNRNNDLTEILFSIDN